MWLPMMDISNTYIVAEEDDDDHNIVIVSSTWLTPKKQEAFWPRFKQTTQYNKSLIKHETPDNQTWRLITLKRKFYETAGLMTARIKAKQAESTSDLNDYDETRKRKTKKPIRVIDSDASLSSEPEEGALDLFMIGKVKNGVSQHTTLDSNMWPLTTLYYIQWNTEGIPCYNKFQYNGIAERILLTQTLQTHLQCNYLMSFCGNSSTSSVNQIMRHMISNELASKFSYRGKKGKRPFEQLNLKAVLIHYQLTYEEDEGNSNGTPVITLEVMSDCSNIELCPDGDSSDVPSNGVAEPDSQDAGVHFLTKKHQSEAIYDNENLDDKDQDANESSKARNDLLEYMTRNDGSVVCKLCGEILQSRTHWYRHKYKRHVIQPLNPAPLFQCEQCLVFFKSRKGYIGHLSSRHSEIMTDPSPVLTRSVPESVTEKLPLFPAEVKREPEAELISHGPELDLHRPELASQRPETASHKATVPGYEAPVKHAPMKTAEHKRSNKGNKDNRTKENWEEKRYREEKLVADIIDRVKKECEAQGGNGGARRGYTRRTTVMHT